MRHIQLCFVFLLIFILSIHAQKEIEVNGDQKEGGAGLVKDVDPVKDAFFLKHSFEGQRLPVDVPPVKPQQRQKHLGPGNWQKVIAGSLLNPLSLLKKPSDNGLENRKAVLENARTFVLKPQEVAFSDVPDESSRQRNQRVRAMRPKNADRVDESSSSLSSWDRPKVMAKDHGRGYGVEVIMRQDRGFSELQHLIYETVFIDDRLQNIMNTLLIDKVIPVELKPFYISVRANISNVQILKVIEPKQKHISYLDDKLQIDFKNVGFKAKFNFRLEVLYKLAISGQAVIECDDASFYGLITPSFQVETFTPAFDHGIEHKFNMKVHKASMDFEDRVTITLSRMSLSKWFDKIAGNFLGWLVYNVRGAVNSAIEYALTHMMPGAISQLCSYQLKALLSPFFNLTVVPVQPFIELTNGKLRLASDIKIGGIPSSWIDIKDYNGLFMSPRVKKWNHGDAFNFSSRVDIRKDFPYTPKIRKESCFGCFKKGSTFTKDDVQKTSVIVNQRQSGGSVANSKTFDLGQYDDNTLATGITGTDPPGQRSNKVQPPQRKKTWYGSFKHSDKNPTEKVKHKKTDATTEDQDKSSGKWFSWLRNNDAASKKKTREGTQPELPDSIPKKKKSFRKKLSSFMKNIIPFRSKKDKLS